MPERTRLTMSEVHAVVALRAAHWPVMDGEGHSVALPKWHHLGAALHARPLFGQHELATCEVHAGLREKNRDLDWECEVAVEILVEAIEVTWDILQKKRARLASIVTPLEERHMVVGIALVDSHSAVPFAGHACEVRIERRLDLSS
jgi:hypothetical protein